MMEKAIQIAVARADLIISQIGSLPWERIGLSLLIAIIVVKVLKDI